MNHHHTALVFKILNGLGDLNDLNLQHRRLSAQHKVIAPY